MKGLFTPFLASCFLLITVAHGVQAQDVTVNDSKVETARSDSPATSNSQPDEDAPPETPPEDAKEPSSTKELIKAVILNDRDKIKDLLADGVDINAADKRGLTPLQAAKVTGDSKLATMLEVLGAEPDSEFDPREFVDRSLKLEEKAGHPGVAVLIAKGNEILFSGGVGLASIEHQAPITRETKFRIGSVSKQFAAAAILKLQEDGKLSVTDTLDKFIPDFPRGAEVTLHHLLTHTSGLKNYTSDADFFETVAATADMKDMVESFKEAGFDKDPGEDFAYCNTGYFLLSHIVELVSEQAWGEFLKTNFFEPLEMHDTGTHDATEIYVHEATGYSVEEEELKKALDWDMSRARGAGDIYSTVVDLHKWNQGIFGDKILSEESRKQAHQLQVKPKPDDEANDEGGIQSIEMPYGYGWMIDEHRGLKRVWHTGGLNGFVSMLVYYPDQQMTVVALHNAFPSIPAFTPEVICTKVAEVFLWQDMEDKPEFEVMKDVDPDVYDDYVGKYDYIRAVMNVTREGDKLMAQLTGQPNFQIFPYAKDKFFWKVVDAQAEFQRDEDGNVTGVRHSQGISKFLALRLKDRTSVELSEDQLDRYVGKYKYGVATLTVRREGNQLFAKMSGQPENKIFAEAENKLFWKVVNAQLEVEFDEEGKITSATHHQGGQNISVEKVE